MAYSKYKEEQRIPFEPKARDASQWPTNSRSPRGSLNTRCRPISP